MFDSILPPLHSFDKRSDGDRLLIVAAIHNQANI